MFKDNTKQEGFNVLFTFQNLTEKKKDSCRAHLLLGNTVLTAHASDFKYPDALHKTICSVASG